MLVYWTANSSFTVISYSVLHLPSGTSSTENTTDDTFQATGPDLGLKIPSLHIWFWSENLETYIYIFDMAQKPKSYYPKKTSYKPHAHEDVLMPGF